MIKLKDFIQSQKPQPTYITEVLWGKGTITLFWVHIDLLLETVRNDSCGRSHKQVLFL